MNSAPPSPRRVLVGGLAYFGGGLVVACGPMTTLAVLNSPHWWWGTAWWAVVFVPALVWGGHVLAWLTGLPRPTMSFVQTVRVMYALRGHPPVESERVQRVLRRQPPVDPPGTAG